MRVFVWRTLEINKDVKLFSAAYACVYLCLTHSSDPASHRPWRPLFNQRKDNKTKSKQNDQCTHKNPNTLNWIDLCRLNIQLIIRHSQKSSWTITAAEISPDWVPLIINPPCDSEDNDTYILLLQESERTLMVSISSLWLKHKLPLWYFIEIVLAEMETFLTAVLPYFVVSTSVETPVKVTPPDWSPVIKNEALLPPCDSEDNNKLLHFVYFLFALTPLSLIFQIFSVFQLKKFRWHNNKIWHNNSVQVTRIYKV